MIVTPDRLPYIVREALAVAFGFGAPVPSGARTAEWVDFLFSALRFQAVRIDVPGSASASLCRDCQPSRRSCCVSGFCRANTVQGRKPRFAPTASVKNNCSEAAVCRARCFSAGAGTVLFRAVRGAFRVSAAIVPSGSESLFVAHSLGKKQPLGDRKSTRLNSSHSAKSRMPSSA